MQAQFLRKINHEENKHFKTGTSYLFLLENFSAKKIVNYTKGS